MQREVYIYTFCVNKMIKGPSRSHLSVKQSKMLVEMKQVPTYRTGDEVILFLSGESRWGFSSPVGLGQGKFSVRYLKDGSRQVRNENNNSNLFKGMDRKTYFDLFAKTSYQSRIVDVLSQKSGPINYDLFIDVVEALLREGQ